MHTLEQLMRCVLRIEARLPGGEVSVGSGFIYRFAQRDEKYVPAIITNKHVIEGAKDLQFPISTQDESSESTGHYEVIRYEIGDMAVMHHPDPEVDLCAILAAPILNHFEKRKQKPLLRHITIDMTANEEYFHELLPLEDVVMIGYPNGLWDKSNNGAIARKGAIATVPQDNYQGRNEFVIDMACFPGSSGSPVFLVNFGDYVTRNGVSTYPRVKLLGILYAGPQYAAGGDIITVPIPTTNRAVAVTSIPNNLGYVIKAFELNELNEIALERSQAEAS